MNTQPAAVLSNPRATRTGHVHYVGYIPQGNMVDVVLDDCMTFRRQRMSKADARADYCARLADGWIRDL